MTRSLTRVQAIVLAIVVLAGLALGVYGLFAASSRNWLPDAFHIRAGFQDVGGVAVGTRVRVQGIDAGEVEAVEPPASPGGDVTLRLRLAGKYRSLIPADSKVEIAGESLLGGKVVRILPGSASAGPVEDGAVLAGRNATDLVQGLAQATSRLNTVLAEADGALAEFRKGEGPVGKAARDLNEATAKINKLLGEVDVVVKDVQAGKGTLGKLVKDEKLYGELIATLGEVKGALHEVKNGEGTVGKLVKSAEVYNEALKSLQDVRQLVASVKQNSDAIKALPVVRSYVVDVNKALIRPDCARHRRWYSENALFEPGRAVLTDRGRQHLDAAAGWLNENKHNGSQVVVAAFASPDRNSDFGQTLSQKQAEVVAEYLKANHKVHRMGFWWFDNREVRAIGCGTAPSPVPEKEKLPSARLEVILFVPQG